MRLPVRVTPVRVIGGPQGSPIGRTGPTGPIGDSLVGPIGLEGVTGRAGHVGNIGATGMDSTMTGPAGAPGPTGSVGFTGPTGPQAKAYIPATQMGYFQNEPGVVNVGAGSGHFVGCGFRHKLRKSGSTIYASVMFTGLIQSSAGTTRIEVSFGSPPAPLPGTGGFVGSYMDNRQTLLVPPGKTYPFFIANYNDFGSEQDLWLDLRLINSAGNFTTVRNLSCLLLEF